MPSYVPIITIRGTSTVIDDTPVHDGQILFDESRKCLFMDNGNTRNKYSGLGADSNVATVEDTTTSTHAYAKGDYVVVEGQLYEVTAAIAVGDTFSVGTNVSVTTVGDELVQIKSDLTTTSNTNWDSTGSVASNVRYYKIEKVNGLGLVNLSFEFSSNSTATNSWETILTIQSQYRPNKEIPFSINSINGIIMTGMIWTNGKVQFVKQNAGTIQEGMVNVTYFI